MKSYVYLIYNQVNGKLYVGKSLEHEDRWGRHQRIARGGKEKYPHTYSAIHAALNKYGFDHFTFKKIESFDTENKALQSEMGWIKTLRELNYVLYNLTDGGEGSSGYKHTPESIEKMRIINTGSGNPCYGRVKSRQERKAISARQRGNKHSPERIANMVAGRKARSVGVGIKNGRAKLTEDIVREMREKFPKLNLTYAELGKKYNISQRAAYMVIKNISYKNVI